MSDFVFRSLRPDECAELNTLLRESYASLATAGMHYAAAFEDLEATRRNLVGCNCHIVGSRLLDRIEEHSRVQKYRELALDTSEQADAQKKNHTQQHSSSK